MAFARVLYNKPELVFLDESTSAVDMATETQLYESLIASKTAFVSVGHRNSLLKFHHTEIRILGPGVAPVIAPLPPGVL